MPYAVSTPVFEGPFDLLLHLITREQVDLFEVSLSVIVDAYLVEIDRMQVLDLDVATEFLLIAATLVELKLRRLLPEREGVDLDEELALLEERDLLLAKLLEYRTFKEASRAIERRMLAASKSLPRPGGLDERFADLTPDLLDGVSPERLRAAFVKVVTRFLTPKLVPRVTLDHVTAVRVTVAETVADLASVLPRRGRVSFRELTVECEDRMEVIVHFLAILELCKQGWVDLDQAANFAELQVTWRPDGPDVEQVNEVVGELLDDARRAEAQAAARDAAANGVPTAPADAAEHRPGPLLTKVDDYEG